MNDAPLADLQALHRGLLTLDTHIDIPWPNGPDPFQDGPRRVDLPKMQRGGLAAGCFVAYVPQAARTPRAIPRRSSVPSACCKPSVAWGAARTASPRASPSPPMRSLPPSATACWRSSRRWRTASRWAPTCRGSRASGALGARYLTLTHNGHNALADSCNPRTDLGDALSEHGGLSPLGRAAVAELNRLGMLVDVAHVSRDTMLQAAELSRTPVVSTHSCVRALCDHPRNMDDCAARCPARRGRRDPDHRGGGVPETGRQARRDDRGRLRRPHRLCRAPHRHRACRHLLAF